MAPDFIPCKLLPNRSAPSSEWQVGSQDKEFAVKPTEEARYSVVELRRRDRPFGPNWNPRKYFKKKFGEALFAYGLRVECLEQQLEKIWHGVELGLRQQENEGKKGIADFKRSQKTG